MRGCVRLRRGRVTASWERCADGLVPACELVRFLVELEVGAGPFEVVQKIGSASDVGIAGFSGPTLTSGPRPVALLVNDTLGGSSLPCQKFRELPRIVNLIPLQYESCVFCRSVCPQNQRLAALL